jgi:prepilin-type N-terminal cleavage/methylation domain-containing protein
MKFRTRRKVGFTFMEIMIVVTIIGLLVAIVIPNLIRARANAQAKVCIRNLHLLDSATQQWALEHDQGPDASVSSNDVMPYLGRSSTGQWPTCPAGGSYTMTFVSEKPVCSLGSTVTPPHELP